MSSIVRILDSKNPDKFLMNGIDTSAKPHYLMQETAKVFFGKTSEWLRRKERDGYLTLDGEDITPDVHPSGVRYYTIAGIEKVAHALAQSGQISLSEMKQVLKMVEAQAYIWKYK